MNIYTHARIYIYIYLYISINVIIIIKMLFLRSNSKMLLRTPICEAPLWRDKRDIWNPGIREWPFRFLWWLAEPYLGITGPEGRGVSSHSGEGGTGNRSVFQASQSLPPVLQTPTPTLLLAPIWSQAELLEARRSPPGLSLKVVVGPGEECHISLCITPRPSIYVLINGFT